MSTDVDVKVALAPGVADGIPWEKDVFRKDFALYKAGKGTPDYLGKDVPFDFPEWLKSAGVHHVHLKLSDSWNERKQTSDDHLIYCQHWDDQNAYLLIEVITPDAHNLHYDNNRREYWVRWADKFNSETAESLARFRVSVT